MELSRTWSSHKVERDLTRIEGFEKEEGRAEGKREGACCLLAIPQSPTNSSTSTTRPPQQ